MRFFGNGLKLIFLTIFLFHFMCNKHLDIKKLQLLAWKKLRTNGKET